MANTNGVDTFSWPSWPAPLPGIPGAITGVVGGGLPSLPGTITGAIGGINSIGNPTLPAHNVAAPLADLFKFSLDWRFLGAVTFMLLTVGLVEELWPDYVWPYVGILLLGLAVVNTRFGPNLDRLVGR